MICDSRTKESSCGISVTAEQSTVWQKQSIEFFTAVIVWGRAEGGSQPVIDQIFHYAGKTFAGRNSHCEAQELEG